MLTQFQYVQIIITTSRSQFHIADSPNHKQLSELITTMENERKVPHVESEASGQNSDHKGAQTFFFYQKEN